MGWRIRPKTRCGVCSTEWVSLPGWAPLHRGALDILRSLRGFYPLSRAGKRPQSIFEAVMLALGRAR